MGVLRYALGTLAPRLGRPAAATIFCGPGVGAINAGALAARAEAEGFGVPRVAARGESLRLDHIFRLGWGDPAALARWLIGRTTPGGAASLLDAAPLADLVRDVILWRSLHDNIASGRVQAATVSATDLETGHTVVFVERRAEEAIETPDSAVEWVPARLRPQHTLASAAIPIVFPTVRAGGRIFTDGGVRQNTPIAPAIRPGCGRV